MGWIVIAIYALAVVVTVFAVFVCCPRLGWYIGTRRDAPLTGLFFGLFGGPFGVLLMLAIDQRRSCPLCIEPYRSGATVCPHCGNRLIPDERVESSPAPYREAVKLPALSSPPIVAEPDDWMKQNVEVTPAQADWVAKQGRR